MGEEVVDNKEEAKVEETTEKKEEAAAEGEEKKKEEEAADPPSPPAIVILGVEVHCTGCAKRIKRSILRCKGVEGVEVDMAANQLTVKGIVDPQVLCARLHKKTKRNATVISPLLPPADEAEQPPPPPPPPPPQVSEVRTVELLVNMHCEACAQQLQKKILKMKGVQTADTELTAGKLTVTGTMTDDKIVEYIHRRTGKLATVVPPPPEHPKEEEPKKDEVAAPQPPPPEGEADKKEEEDKPADDDGAKPKAEEAEEEKKEAGEEEKPAKQDQEAVSVVVDGFPPEEMMKRMVYWPYGGYKQAEPEEAMMAKRMAMHAMPPHPYAMMHWMPPPSPPPPPAPMQYYNHYMVERPAPAPQLFSDENPNACVIS